jgi:16S rRNA (guanine527-N7)-methyltransferase
VSASRLEEILLERAGRSGLTISPTEVLQLEEYWAVLARWNQKVNLTALPLGNYPARSVDRLILEPLAAARLVQVPSFVWFDLGSGGGSPAIPLKILCPLGRLTMVESKSRKAAFLREVVRTLRLADVEVVQRRIDVPSAGKLVRGNVDLVTLRAVRLDASVQRAILELLKPGGRAFLFASAERKIPLMEGLALVSSYELPGSKAVLYVYSRPEASAPPL